MPRVPSIRIRFTYVASEAGLRYGWSTIYDASILRSLSSGFPPTQQSIGALTYINPPLLAWVFAPLTLFSEPIAYAIWTAISLIGLVVAWQLAAPYHGLAKATLLMLAIGLWPLLLVLYTGQPDLVVMALVAASWWMCACQRWHICGACLAFAIFLKPQVVWLIPPALLISGRYAAFVACLLGCAVLGAMTLLALQPSGLLSWWQSLQSVQADPAHTAETLVHIFGFGPLTISLWIVQAIAALLVACRDRRPEIVFAVGILGTVAAGFHFHYWDYTILVLAAWLVLRTSPPTWHRMWLLVGIVPLQLIEFQAAHANVPFVAPQLAWDAIWLGILVAQTFTDTQSPTVTLRSPAPETA